MSSRSKFVYKKNLVSILSSLINKYKNVVLPRLVYLPYYLACILSFVVSVVLFFNNRKVTRSTIRSFLCIEAGVKGWEIIEYKELYKSAVEYLDDNSVGRLIINSDSSYLAQVHKFIIDNKPTHYAYSPRTGGQDWFTGLRDAFGILILLRWYGVTPIVFLTDLPVRLWRTQSAVATASQGLVVSLMSPRLVSTIFPHDRIIGPYVMPFSERTLNYFKESEKFKKSESYINPLFTGALYEPRTSTLRSIEKGLSKRGIQFDILGRGLGDARVSDDDYWWRLISAPIILTTADQMPQKGADWPWLPHFVYRYTEVLACGALLFAPELTGISRYFTPGVHYISYENVDDAVEKIVFYFENPAERKKIAKEGNRKMSQLIYCNAFWLGIDISLGQNSIK